MKKSLVAVHEQYCKDNCSRLLFYANTMNNKNTVSCRLLGSPLEKYGIIIRIECPKYIGRNANFPQTFSDLEHCLQLIHKHSLYKQNTKWSCVSTKKDGSVYMSIQKLKKKLALYGVQFKGVV